MEQILLVVMKDLFNLFYYNGYSFLYVSLNSYKKMWVWIEVFLLVMVLIETLIEGLNNWGVS